MVHFALQYHRSDKPIISKRKSFSSLFVYIFVYKTAVSTPQCILHALQTSSRKNAHYNIYLTTWHERLPVSGTTKCAKPQIRRKVPAVGATTFACCCREISIAHRDMIQVVFKALNANHNIRFFSSFIEPYRFVTTHLMTTPHVGSSNMTPIHHVGGQTPESTGIYN